MGKYGNAIGIWKLEFNGAILELHPKKGDNYKMLNLVKESKIKNDEIFFLKQFHELIKEIISRDYPPMDTEEKQELEEAIEYNIMELLHKTMLAFKLADESALNKAKQLPN